VCLIQTSPSRLKRVEWGIKGEVGCVFAFIPFAAFKVGPPAKDPRSDHHIRHPSISHDGVHERRTQLLNVQRFSGQAVTWANGKPLPTIETNGALTEHQAKPTSVKKDSYSPPSIAETRASSEVAPNASVTPPHLPVSRRRTECAAAHDGMERYLGRGPRILRVPHRDRLVDSCRS